MGLSSGVAVAALVFGGLWLALFVGTGSKDPTLTFANYVFLTLPGLIVYPACWYGMIFRYRDYSLHRTMTLVVATFAAVCAIVVALMSAGGAYVAITPLLPATQLANLWKIALIAAVIPFAYALMVLIGAVILIVPYASFATPMALAHRWLLLRFFGPASPAMPPFSQTPLTPSSPDARPPDN